ncbi:hypothetical protein TNCV_3014831 [Trichonephila clavipes]|nr:hypothetical protein TNCV_3014831 [Trichonephila clavipes]
MRKTPSALDCPIISSEGFVVVNDDNVCTAPIIADKDILEFVQSSKNIINADSNGKNEINNAAPVQTIAETRNIVKSIRIYLDAHFNGEMNKKWTTWNNLLTNCC